MRRPSLDSMLLGTTDPERLHAWYAGALSPEEDTRAGDYRVLRFGTFHLFIDGRDDVGATNAEPARVLVNFDVADARAVAARIDELGSPWVAPLEDRDGSLFATAADPDGNLVQIIQISEAHRAEMGRSTGPLAAGTPFSSFAVDDLAAARRFYSDTLGLPVAEEGMLLRLSLALGQDVLVYPKDDHVPASFTVLNFPVDDIEAAVDALVERGVRFERYDGFDQDERGIERSGRGPLVAWFTDPAGNVLSVLQEQDAGQISFAIT